MGVIDLLGKLAGAGDVLAPIRTASYAMLTDVSLGGFARIAGAYSEASAFGGVSLACLAFSYTYWRKTKDRLARWLSVILLLRSSCSLPRRPPMSAWCCSGARSSSRSRAR